MEKRIERLNQTERPREARKLHASFKERNFSGDEVVAMDGLTKGFEGRTLFSGLSAIVEGGERVAIIGDNGTGKSTLVKLIVGEEQPDAGWVAPRPPSVRMAYLPQIVKFNDTSRTALDTLIYDCRCSPQEARDSLAAFGFPGEDALKEVGTLSGNRYTYRLCMLMRSDVNLLILDEPTNHLDIASREWMEDALSGYGEALMFVSHDRYFIEKFATRIWAFADGTVTDFRGGFADYRAWRERQEAIKHAAKAAEPKPEKKPARKKGTPEREKALRRTEREIEKLEARMKELDAEAEANAADYQRLMAIEEERGELSARLDALYEEWEGLSEEG